MYITLSHSNVEFDPVSQTSTLIMKGQGTSGVITGLDFTCFVTVSWYRCHHDFVTGATRNPYSRYDLSGKSVPSDIGGCPCSFRVNKVNQYDGINTYFYNTPCLSPLVEPPSTGYDVTFEDTVSRLPRWPMMSNKI